MWGGQPVPAAHQARVLRTVDGGLTWQAFDPAPMLGRVPFTLEAVSADEVHVTVCNTLQSVTPAVLASTTDAGATWTVRTQLELAGSIGIFLVNFDADHWFAYGFDTAATWSDGGATWTAAPVPPLQFGVNEFIIYSSTNNTIARLGDALWIPTSRGRIFHSPDRGETWSTSLTPFHPGRGITTLAFHDPLRAMAMSCYTSGFALTTPEVAVTLDGGATWVVRPGPPGPVSSLVAVPGLPGAYIGVVEGDVPTVGSYLTLDDGLTWQTIDTDQPYNGLKFVDQGTGWTGLGMAASSNADPALFTWSGGLVGLQDDPVERSSLRLLVRDGRVAVLLPEDVRGDCAIRSIDSEGRVVGLQRIRHAQAGSWVELGNMPRAGVYTVELVSLDRRYTGRCAVMP
jgi:photosystem II stability/assembly factor-like uncharacterized protein